MSLSIYQVSVPAFVRGLTVLATLLEKAAAHADAADIDPSELINARLAPDMYPLSGQIQRASDTSKFAIQRLSQGEAPKFPDEETTFEQLQKRIADTIAYVQSVTPDQLDGSESRKIVLNAGEFKPEFNGASYLLTFALPNFYFHVTTAYDILRNAGVKIGKFDFLGPFEQASQA
ncbi:DUF1993 domain-containing protein [Achromobacter seleniivolatilans]|uniref:DUF1993 domain-containing protein n=1 Tax=Achromobacter seleniivolatilans TaxID=3047478 RepID=A0ABY9M2B2_9BURK|nr:DUF1993 domain-containing protein [Achromobacter sp. R39]WMD21157.1 DUF1993 domain-containing protein [Achromobacter sp. R39]